MAAVSRSKIVECELEVPKGVVYHGWEPGKEYTKPLVVKNVQLQTQMITYTVYFARQHRKPNAHFFCFCFLKRQMKIAQLTIANTRHEPCYTIVILKDRYIQIVIN